MEAHSKAQLTPTPQGRRLTLRQSLTLWLTLLVLIPVSIMAGVNYLQTKAALIDAAKEELEQIAYANKLFIDNWFQQRFNEAALIASDVSTLALQQKLLKARQDSTQPLSTIVHSSDWHQLVENDSGRLQQLATKHPFIENLLLLNSNADVLYTLTSSNALGVRLFEQQYTDTKLAEAVRFSLSHGDMEFSGIESSRLTNNKLASFIIVPMRGETHQILGVLAVQIKLDHIFNLLTRKSIHHRSMVHYLVDRNGLLHSPLTGATQDILHRTVSTEQIRHWQQLQSQQTNNSDGIFEYIGPNQLPVFGIRQGIHLAHSQWGLISEINRDDALDELESLSYLSLVVFCASVIISLLMALLIAKRLSTPITHLANAARQMASGASSRQLDVSGSREIAIMAQAFNHMVQVKHHQEQSLKHSNQDAQQLLKKLEHYKFILDQHAVVSVTDLSGAITFVNDKFCQLCQYDRAELLGQNHRILNFGIHSRAFFTEMYHKIGTGEIWHGEICNRNKSGQAYWLNLTIAPFIDDQGQPQNYIAIGNDITAQKRTEADNKHNLSLLSATIDATDSGFLVVDLKGEIINFNHRLLELLQIPEAISEINNKESLLRFIFAQVQDAGQFLLSTEKIYANPLQDSYDMIYLKNGSILERQSKPMLIDKQATGRVWSFRDVTSRITYEQQQQALHQITEIKLTIAKIINQPGLFSEKLNDALSELLTLDYLCHQGAGAIFSLEQPQPQLLASQSIHNKPEDKFIRDLNAMLEHSTAPATQVQVQINSITSGNGSIELCQYLVPLINPGADNLQVFGLMLLYGNNQPGADSNSNDRLRYLQEVGDIFATALIQEQARELLKQASAIAEQSSRLKSEFLASMSHEIRTPMNGVLGMLDLLAHSQLTAEQQRQVTLATSSAESLLTLINDILDFSKVEAGKLELDIRDFSLTELLSEFAESMALRAQEKGLQLILDISEIQHDTLCSDPGRIRQILTNLVGNAIKFTEQGEIIIRASTKALSAQQCQLSCQIIDSGIGISQQQGARLFEPFSQADASTTRKYGGTGLGLSISKKLCQLMHGQIGVESKENQGSCFHFTLQLNNSEVQAVPRVNEAFKQLNILLVEHNSKQCEALQKQLATWGCQTVTADSAAQALARCQKRVDTQQPMFDLVLLDRQLADDSSLSLAQKFKQTPAFANMVLVLLTPLNLINEALNMTQLGFSAAISTPVTPHNLFNVVRDTLPEHVRATVQQPKALLSDNNKNQPQPMLSFDGYRLLLVEDNHTNQLVANGILQRFGVKADTADNGVLAIQALCNADTHSPYDLVLMDCQMPEMDGYEASRQIRAGKAGECYRQLPIIAMTANAMQGDKEKCLAAGMNDYLTKPIEPEALADKLQQWLPDRAKQKTPQWQEQPASATTDTPVPASEGDPQQVWDTKAVLQRLMGQQQLLTMLIDSFVTEMPARIELLFKAAESHNLDDIRLIAHTIKGVAGNLGGNALQQAAKLLEQAARPESDAPLQHLLHELKLAYQQLHQQFNNYLSQASQSKDIAASSKETAP